MQTYKIPTTPIPPPVHTQNGHFSRGSVCFCTGFLTFFLWTEKNGVTVPNRKLNVLEH